VRSLPVVGARVNSERIREEREAFARLHAGDAGARAELVERHLPLVRHLARRFAGGVESLEDLEQVGAIGLLNAIDRYDPASGNAFSSFAVPTILGEIRRHFRDKTWPLRVPRSLKDLALATRDAAAELERRTGQPPTAAELADALGVDVERLLDARLAADAQYPDSLDRVVRRGEDDSATLHELVPAEDDAVDRAEGTLSLQMLTSRLEPRDREILRLRFEEDLTQSDIAARVGLSQMHVSRLLRDALDRLAPCVDEDRARSGLSAAASR
jgi:RNA polymerase sigma-B factor